MRIFCVLSLEKKKRATVEGRYHSLNQKERNQTPKMLSVSGVFWSYRIKQPGSNQQTHDLLSFYTLRTSLEQLTDSVCGYKLLVIIHKENWT